MQDRYIRIKDQDYPVIQIFGRVHDQDWDNRESKSIHLDMNYIEVSAVFVNGCEWSIVDKHENKIAILDETGAQKTTDSGELMFEVTASETVYDNSDFNIVGDVTQHPDGTITVKMGKLTELEEAYEIMLGGI